MQPSPYTPGEVARRAWGRDVQLAEIDERLDYMVALQRLVARIRVDHAPRGVGKTSLLREAQRHAEARGAATVWVTAGESGGLVPAIASETERLARGWSEQARKPVRDALRGLQLKVSGGVPGVASIEASWAHGARGDHAVARPASATREFEDVIAAVTRSAGEQSQTGLVLLVDEIQAADPEGLRTVSYAWQHFQAERPDLPAAVLAAGLPESVAKINQAVSNSERFAYRKLGDLSPEAAAVVLAEPARDLGVTWSRQAIDRAVEGAAGYPHTLQLIGDNAWRRAGRPDPGGQITAGDVEAARADVAQDLDELYTARLSKITRPTDIEFVKALAGLGDGPVRRVDIAAALGKPSDALGIPRDRLLGSGVIAETSWGHVAFTIPGFAAHVRRAYGIDER